MALYRSYAPIRPIKGERHLDMSNLLHKLADVLKAQGDLTGARARLERSLEISAECVRHGAAPGRSGVAALPCLGLPSRLGFKKVD